MLRAFWPLMRRIDDCNCMDRIALDMNDSHASATSSGSLLSRERHLPQDGGDKDKSSSEHKPAALHDFAIIGRLLRDYMRRRWNRLLLAGTCMIVTAAMNGMLAWLLDPAIKHIFLENNARMLPIITAA